jgi:HEPN domain-containing protein
MDIKEYSKETFSIAKDDLIDARRLYENERYNNALYHLQQSVEKIAKSIAIESGVISKKDALNISHRTFDIFKLIRKNVTKFFSSKEFMKLGLDSDFFIKSIKKMDDYGQDDFKEFINLMLKIWDRASQDSSKIKLTDEELKSYINELKLTKEIYLKGRPYIQNLTFKEPEVVRFKNWFIDCCSDTIIDIGTKAQKKTNEEITNINKRDIRDTLDSEIQKLITNGELKGFLLASTDLLFISISIFYLSVLTQPHVSSTRYVKDDISPRQVYTSDLPIIKEFNFLLEITEMTVDIISGKYGLKPLNLIEQKSEQKSLIKER